MIKLSISKKFSAIVAVPIVLNLLFIAVLGYLLGQVEAEARRLEQSRAIVSQANIIARLPIDECMGLIAYNLTGSKLFLSSYERSAKQIPKEVELLRRLVDDDKEQLEAVTRIDNLINQGLALMEKVRISADATSGIDSFMANAELKSSMERIIQKLLAELQIFMKLEDDIEDPSLLIDSSARSSLETAILVGIALNILVALFLTVVFNRNVSVRLSQLMENTDRFARGEKLRQKSIGGSDELSKLDEKFKEMALVIEQANRQQRAILEQASEVICQIDKGFKFSSVNAACESIWGYHTDDLRGRRVIDIVYSNDRSKTIEYFESFSSGEKSRTFENRIVKRDGIPVHMQWSVQWSESEQSFICVAHDINARKQVEQLRQDFLEMVSHDIRSPLTAVSAILELIKVGAAQDQLDKNLAIGQRNVDKILRLLDELLDIQRVEAGKLELEIRSINAKSMIEEAVEVILPTADKRDIKVEIEDCSFDLECDVERLRQVFINLLSNALKYSPRGSKITVSFEKLSDSIRISVTDQGKGIPEEFRDHIFDRFQQVEAADDKKKGGKGLGLAICKAIVEAHNGAIGVESELDKGSTFWVRIPFTVED